MDLTTNSYQSTTGFRMWGGRQHPLPKPSPFGWLSVGLVVGVALALGTWFVLSR